MPSPVSIDVPPLCARAGCAIAANHLSAGIKVIGVEPAAGDDVTRSFQTKTLQSVHNPDTIADGARSSSAGTLTFPLILRHVHDMRTVTDEELLRAVARQVLQRKHG